LTNEDFFTAWKEVCIQNEQILKNSWYQPTEYTEIIKGGQNKTSIISQIANKIGLLFLNEYYSTDVLFYKRNDVVQNTSKNGTWLDTDGNWLRKIRIAFEHENKIEGIYHEICHLLTISSDLKVVVTYPNHENHIKYVEDCQSILNNYDVDNKEILLILGFRNTNEDILWEGYILSTQKYDII